MAKTKIEIEHDLIKALFQDNEELLKTIRNLFFGFELSAQELESLRPFRGDTEAFRMIQNRMHPRINRDMPIGFSAGYDPYMGVERMVFGRDADTRSQAIETKKTALDMMDRSLALLRGEDALPVVLDQDFDLNTDPLCIKLLARNQYIEVVDQTLKMFNDIANQGDKKNKSGNNSAK